MKSTRETDDSVLQEFIAESREHMADVEGDLLAIGEESEGADRELVNRVFRAVHSIKGTAGFFGLEKVTELAHAAETVLGKMRDGDFRPSGPVLDALLRATDLLKTMVEEAPQCEARDVSRHVEELLSANSALTGDAADEDEGKGGGDAIKLISPDGAQSFEVAAADLEAAEEAYPQGCTYLLRYTLDPPENDRANKKANILAELAELTFFIAHEEAASPDQEDVIGDGARRSFFWALVRTDMELDMLQSLLDIPKETILPVDRVVSPKAAELASVEERTLDPLPSPREEPPNMARAEADSPRHATVDATGTSRVSQPTNADAHRHDSAKDRAPKGRAPGEPGAGRRIPQPSHPSDRQQSKRSGGAEGSVRVNLTVLDKLMTLAGELVLTRNELVQSLESDRSKTADATQRIDQITTELQDAIMSTRMQSLGSVFGRFRRVVHDLSKNLGKDVELVLEGDDVELDRTIIEAITDPLTHLVRNALDHGIESPEERDRLGKPRRGFVQLLAYHKAGQVVIEITDDGQGIDLERVKAKALARGMYTQRQLDEMSETALTRLIFQPGFSTATEVTDLSGRGVGMDVVYTNLTKLGGVVDVESVLGQGTSVRVKMPLTLAIIPCLLVTEEGETFAVPQGSLVELQRIPARDVLRKIEDLGDVQVMRLRGELLPLVRLRDVLGMTFRTYPNGGHRRLPDRRQAVADRRAPDSVSVELEDGDRRGREDRRRAAASAVNIAIVAAGDLHFGLIVEGFQDSLEIVVKPLGRHLAGCHTYAGATILGDGRTALILDVAGICRRVMADGGTEATLRAAKERTSSEARGQEHTLLLAHNSDQEQLAIPIESVERILRTSHAQLQCIGGRRSMVYRGGALLICDLADMARVSPGALSLDAYLVIFRQRQREMGLLVSSIVDVVTVEAPIDRATLVQPGVAGSLLIGDSLTMLVDLAAVASHYVGAPAAGSEQEISVPPPSRQDQGRKRVLVVDDSKFFLNKIKAFVEELGYETLTAGDGAEALDLLTNSDRTVHLVLTDIEMPQMDGFELTQRIRRDARFRDIPVLAVTSLMGEEAVARGRAVGIDDYLIKLDRDTMLERATYFLAHGRGGPATQGPGRGDSTTLATSP